MAATEGMGWSYVTVIKVSQAHCIVGHSIPYALVVHYKCLLMYCGRYPGTPWIQEICILSSIYVLHLSFFLLSVPSPNFSAACLILLILLYCSSHPALPLFVFLSLSFVYMPFSFFFPFSKLIKERVLVGNPVGEKKSILSDKNQDFFYPAIFVAFLSLSFSCCHSSEFSYAGLWSAVEHCRGFYEVLFHWFLID